METPQLAKLFNTLDTGTLLELLLIVAEIGRAHV